MKTVLPNALVAGPALYEVVDTHEHTTLKTGDIVALTVDQKHVPWLVRVHDFTLHHLSDYEEQFVHLKPHVPPRRPTKAKPGITWTEPIESCSKCCAQGLRTTDEYLAGRNADGHQWSCPTCGRLWVYAKDIGEKGVWRPAPVKENE